MKKIILLALVIITGCILTTGCITQKTTSPSGATAGIQAKDANLNQSSTGGLNGSLNVSIGNYNANLPIYIDDTLFGQISMGKPLSISVSEGNHTVKICDGILCKQVNVDLLSGIKTTLDFGEWLQKDIPQGSLTVSIGNYIGDMIVDVDNSYVGRISTGKPLSINVSEGRHKVTVYSGNINQQQVLEIKSGKLTIVDFGEQLTKAVPQGPLTVSLGGYNAEVPVFVDDANVGNVSFDKMLNLMVGEGHHKVKVCVGIVCETEDVDIKFAQPTFVDFGERLKKDVEFPKPTVRIANSFVSDNVVTINAEFINTDKTDHTMTAIFGCGYSYIDWNSKQRKNDFAQTQVSQFVKAGDQQTQQITLYLNKGSNIYASEPMIVFFRTN